MNYDPDLRVNCVLFTQDGKCAHPDYLGLFRSAQPCIHHDRRVKGCKIQVEYQRPAGPPEPPPSRVVKESGL